MLASLVSRVAPGVSVRKRFASGSLWSLLGTLAAQGPRLGAFILAARLLGKESFGELGILQNTVSMAGVFAGMGLGLTATKHVAQFRTTDPERAGRIIGLSYVIAAVSGVVFCLVLRQFASIICSDVLNAPRLTSELQIASLLVGLNTLQGAQTGALAGFEAFRPIAIANLVQGMLVFPAVIGGAWSGGLIGAIIGLVIAATAGCTVIQFLLFRECRTEKIRLGFRGLGQELSVLTGFSLPTLLTGMMNLPVQWMAAAILVKQPGGFAEMGAFSAANQWRTLILFLPAILERTMLPILADLDSRRDHVSYRRTVHTHLLLSFGAATLLATPLAIGAPLIMKLYGEEFVSSWPVLPLLSGATVIASASFAVGTVMISRGAMWLGLAVNSLWGISLIISAALLTPSHGGVGLGLSFLIAYGIQGLAHLTYGIRIDRSLRERTSEAALRCPTVSEAAMEPSEPAR